MKRAALVLRYVGCMVYAVDATALNFKIQKMDQTRKIVLRCNFWSFGLQSMLVFGVQKNQQQ